MHPSPDNVIEAVAGATGVATTDIVRSNASRRPRHVAARRVTALILHRYAGRSYPEIAADLRYRSHTSVLDGVRAAERGDDRELLGTEPADMARELAATLGLFVPPADQEPPEPVPLGSEPSGQ